MRVIPYFLFIIIFFAEYLAEDLEIIPRYLKFLPEILSAILFVFIMLRFAFTQRFNLHFKYILLFFIFISLVLAGIILNNVSEGTIFSGIRIYFKYVPLFLLHAVYRYSDDQMVSQLKFLLLLALVQVPVSIYQRFFQFHNIATGDVVTGTLLISSIMSVFLVAAITVTVAFYLKKRISGKHALLLSLALFIPTTINETKGTILLLPLSIFILFLFVARTREMRKKIIFTTALLSVIGLTFITIYDQLYERRAEQGGIISFFTEPDQFIDYLYSGIEIDPMLLEPRVSEIAAPIATDYSLRFQRRFDRIMAPIVLLGSEYPLKLVMGLGIGNVSPSFLSSFEGAYAHLQNALGARSTILSHLLWEVGILGVIIYLIFIVFILKDSLSSGQKNDVHGIISLAWVSVCCIVLFSFTYKNLFEFNVIGYLFWYFSGYVVTRNKFPIQTSAQNYISSVRYKQT